jgi:hypothetical protein
MELSELVKEWVLNDVEISMQQKKLKELNSVKKRISNQLMEYMKQSQIDQINLNNEESILYKKSISKKPVNKKILDVLLQQYLEDTDVEVPQLVKFIFENRESVEKESIIKKKA